MTLMPVRLFIVALCCVSLRAYSQERPSVVLPDEIGLASKVGRAVCIHGDMLLASSGRSVVFFELHEGAWEQRDVILSPDEDRAPQCIVLTEHYAAIAWGGDGDRGARDMQIYHLQEGCWNAVQSIAPASVGGTSEFAASMSGDADRLAIGDPGDSQAGKRAGAVHVFQRSENGWVHEAKLSRSDEAESGRLGTHVGLDGDRCVSAGDRTALEDEKGLPHSAVVFHRANGEWKLEATLRSKQSQRPGLLASSPVAIAGDIIVLGNQVAFDTTGAVIFMLIDGAWRERSFVGCLEEHASIFGSRVAATKDIVAIGAPLYVFARSAKWGLVLLNDDFRQSATDFSMSIHNSRIALGLPRDSANDLPSGRVDVWTAPFNDVPPPLKANEVDAMSASVLEARMMWVTTAMYTYGAYDEALKERLSRDFDVLMKQQLEMISD